MPKRFVKLQASRGARARITTVRRPRTTTEPPKLGEIVTAKIQHANEYGLQGSAPAYESA
jgi:hypothetical protein